MFRLMSAAVIGFVLSSGSVRAAEPDKPVRPATDKPPAVDLDDLKYAVKMAEKRGANLGSVAEALDKFEKALANDAIKRGEYYPPLAALREAVEAAANKGENVDAISKELGSIEKALVGRPYERPKPAPKAIEPDPEPAPARPPMQFFRPDRPRGPGFGGRNMGGNPGGNRDGLTIHATSVAVSNGQFAIKSLQGEVTYTITGQTNKSAPIKIVIHAGEKKVVETGDVKKVPDEHRPTVERLLEMVNR